ncbi:MAG: MFS transporter [Elusimicrobia bacterium]|nr:MFS transporter [Elusimicrobiota bacterium]
MARDRYAVLEIGDFRWALLARLFDSFGNQMMGVAAAWQIYQLTKSPLHLGFIGLAEGLPFMAAALWAGSLADRSEKRAMITAAKAGILVQALGLAYLSGLESPPLLPFYACLAWGGFSRSLLWASASTYVQGVVPKELFPKAAAWSTGVLHAATIAGPALSGVVFDRWGARAAFSTVCVLFAAAALCALRLRPMPARPQAAAPGWDGFLSGLRFVRGEPVVLAAMSLDMFGVMFGGVKGVLAMFAVLLGVGASGLGLLQAAPALGALLTSLLMVHRDPFRESGKTFISCVALFGLSMIAFALSRNFWLSAALLAFGGAVDCVGMILRSSIYQAVTPEGLRGRVNAVNGIFIRSSNEIGVFESGLAARFMGLAPSVVFGGCMTLVSVGVALALAPALWRFRLAPDPDQ